MTQAGTVFIIEPLQQSYVLSGMDERQIPYQVITAIMDPKEHIYPTTSSLNFLS